MPSENDHLVSVPSGDEQQQQQENDDAPTLTPEEEAAAKRKACFKKALFAVILVAFIAYVIADSLTTKNVSGAVEDFLAWIEDNPTVGIFAFMGVYVVSTVFFIPGSILTLGAGFVFANAFGLGLGVALGTLAVFVGASAGACAAFLIGRYLLRDWVSNLAKKYAIFQALDIAFEEKGLRIMTLLRLSPLIPWNAINYIAGVTSLKFYEYVIALIAILPGTVLYVFLGASAGSLADSASSGDNATVTIIVVVVGVIFGIAAVGVTSYYAKKELNRITAERNAQLEEENQQDDAETPKIEETQASSSAASAEQKEEASN
mmetsp:Transcript_2786/g.6544  ORF Transcript_2786/g.6544 Transcript_2786/m.6544 type:complete len:318 (+) Transcript_2786:196-1149(+)|eukprot:CAMPEP_0113660188 /NCGR_PEP_ID=MMETSP0017_2-20120614/32762_1 /TAXON_ID=2856 /ORGANISM="Cylindrotheca closterium" /LENGTH=317 /DNA_ID=CAMNT_0000574797 /DNA_START=49 /DNA_END=1002 /DNA_ORIENTATION=- /assembly_acc=CAM_ASM_000147